MVVVFLPKNSDFLSRVHWDDDPASHKEIEAFLSQVREVVPHVIDLTTSSFSDSHNFWLDNSTHFKPAVGARILEEAVEKSLGASK